MTSKLLKKEFSLSMHPITPFMLLLSAMVIIPNYPYTVMFFYLTLGIFFTCLSGRENNDVTYSLLLTFSKKDIVKSRMLFCCILQIIQILLMIPFIFASQMLNPTGNAAGMDANLVLIGEGFVEFAIFNLVFFTSYYKNVEKVGLSFIKSSVAVFLFTFADIICCYSVDFVKTKLDTPDNSFLIYKLSVSALGAVIYVIVTAVSFKISSKRFERLDL